MTTTTTRNTIYGPQGQTFRTEITLATGVVGEWYWTAEEALEARDRAFDAGLDRVRVLGLPTVVCGSD